MAVFDKERRWRNSVWTLPRL